MAQFTNQATITYNGLTASSNIVTGEITQILTAWKDATYDEYQTGDVLTYVISLQNSGTTDLTGLTITDNLGAYTFGTGTVTPLTYTGDPVLYYINGILQAAPAAVAGPPMVISGVSVPAGLSTVLIYRVRVNEYAPLGTEESIVNTATIAGGGLSSPITVTETVTPNQAANLSIFKSLNPTTGVENGQVLYTFTLQNTGATAVDAAANLVISDTFTPALDAPIAVTLNGAPWAATGNYTYDATTGLFTTVAGAVTVPAATYTQDATTGLWTVTPGTTTLTVSGTI